MYSKKLVDQTLETFWEMNGKAKICVKLSLVTDPLSLSVLERFSKDDVAILILNINSIKDYSVDELNIYFKATFLGKPHYLTIPYSSIFQLINEEFGSALVLPVEITELKKEKPTRPHLKVVK